MQVRQIKTLVADLCHSRREYFERHAVAVSPAHACTRVACQRVVQFLLDLVC